MMPLLQFPLASSMAPIPVGLGIAFLLSAWMLFHAKGGLPGCGGGSACDAVTRSRWARWGPVPVAGMGAGFYLLMLLLFCCLTLNVAAQWRPTGWAILATLAFIAIGAAGWFLGLTAFVLRKLC